MLFDIPYFQNHWLKQIVPIAVVFSMGYLDFAAFYSLGYKEIYVRHSHGVAISLWILGGIIQFSALLYWLLLLFVGPGKSPRFKALDIYGTDPTLTLVPDYFVCDKYGFPYFCSNSNSITANRSFFLKDVGYSVLKFDHYCLWIGNVIGESNCLFFLKFMTCLVIYLAIFLIYLGIYTRSSMSGGREINHNFIVLYVVCGFWIIMIFALLSVHVMYVSINMTTLDEITQRQQLVYQRWKLRNQGKNVKKKNVPRKEDGKRYINVKKDDYRLVVQFDIMDRPYNLGYKTNWINFIFNGNRTHRLKTCELTTSRFIQSLIIFIVPFIDIPVFFATWKSHQQKHQEDGFSDGQRNLLFYQHHNSEFSEDFKRKIDEKIQSNQCYTALYTRPRDTSPNPPSPNGDSSSNEQKELP